MRVVTFGELMLRLCPPGYGRFVAADTFDATYGGGEANVAVSLAGFGADARYVTRLPANEIGQAAVNSLRRYGVDTSYIARGGSRTGIYYLERGASVRGSKVIYDRAHSAISEASRADFDWDSILAGTDWFHFTGITPALGGELPAICADALDACRRLGVKTSADLNYRKNLWTTAEAQRVMSGLMTGVDLCIANEEDAEKVFGIHAQGADVERGVVDGDSYREVARTLAQRFGHNAVAITLRKSVSASDNMWAASYYDAATDSFYRSREYPLHIVDRVGGGDSFGAGLIYALLSGRSDADALEFAVAASALKHTIDGDYNLINAAEADALIASGGSGRVSR